MKKLILAAVTAGTLALGMTAATAPAQAQIFFGFGSPGYHHGYGWHRPMYRARHWDCWYVNTRRHHRWVQVRRCGWVW
jgi:hypothetical protein